MNSRIKFHSKNDWNIHYYLDRVNHIITEFDSTRVEYDINEIIEFYNINLFMVNSKAKEFITHYQVCEKEISSLIGKFCSKLSDNIIIQYYLQLEIQYREDFWNLFEQYKLFNIITKETFGEILRLKEVSLIHILHHKKIVDFYGEILKIYFMKYPGNARILLDKYELHNNQANNDIYLPKELTPYDKEEIISNYIDSKEVHINLLEVIVNIKKRGDFLISDRLRLKAKKKVRIEKERFFKDNTGIKTEILVTFSEDQQDEIITEFNGTNLHITFSSNWIKDNSDHATLMNNFIYLFEFADMQMRILFVSKESELGVLERVAFMRANTDYPLGVAFQHKKMLILVEMTSYYRVLTNYQLCLEDSIEWFFLDYMKDEFLLDGFNINMSRSSSFLEKCRMLFPELESVLKQYKLYVEDGEIDKELLQISSDPLDYSEIPSIIKKMKYVYGNGKDFNTAKYYLTSDQCMLSYVERLGESYDNLYNLLTYEQIFVSDYNENRHDHEIQWLCEHDLIIICENGQIQWKDKEKVKIIVDLSLNDVLSYWHLPDDLRKAVLRLNNEGMVMFDCSLFSIPEQNYISFLLNKNKYGNGYDIRNKCLHGTQAESHEQYYMYGLIIFIISIIKINDELCLLNEVL